MTRVFLFCIVCLAFVLPAAAKPVLVRSGEHPKFTRLVFQLPSATQWTADLIGNVLTITLSKSSASFDLSAAFKRINTKRIDGLKTEKNRLKISFYCKCDVAVFETATRHLVVDLADEGHTVVEPIVSTQEPQPLGARMSEHVKPKTNKLPWLFGRDPFGQQRATQVNFHALKGSQVSPEDNSELARTRQLLFKQFSIAATRGLLSGSSAQKLEDSGPVFIEKNESIDGIDSPKINIQLSTSSDFSSEFDFENQRRKQTLCQQSIVTFDRSVPFNDKLSTIRKHLYGEFDLVDQDTLDELINHYLSYGFGAEAKVLLATKRSSDLVQMQVGVSEILEHGTAISANKLSGLTDCDTAVALWAVLSTEKHNSTANFNTSSVLRALNELPKDLRKTLAPSLSQRFLDHHQPKTAAAILRSIERLGHTIKGQHQLVKLQITENSSLSDDAPKLERIVQENSQSSPEALVLLIKNKVKRAEPIDDTILELLEAYEFENKGTELGKQLTETRIIALNHSKKHNEALALMKDMPGDFSPTTDTKRAVLTSLVEDANDIDFLEFAFDVEPIDIQRSLPKVSALISKRLHSLGFSEKANRFHAPNTQDRLPTTTQVSDIEPSVLGSIGAIPDGEGLLSASYNAIAQSAEARSRIRSLLKD